MSRRRSISLTGFALALTTGLFMASLWTRASGAPVSRDALSTRFDAGIRNVVIDWDPADVRPEAERRKALFEFIYQTYEASAWIPQSLFDSNLVTQAVVGNVDTIVGEKVGLVLWRDNELVPAFGMAPNAGSGDSLKWTVNCLVCHMAEIDGVAYFGAGTKTFDELWLGEALKRITSEPWRGRLRGSADYDVAADANRILNSHHHDKIDSLTRGRSTAFAASHVELYMRGHDSRMPAASEVGRGDVKTPPLWHTAAKIPIGRWYTDGSFHGPFPLMASSMELEKDRSFDALIQVVMPTIKREFESVVRHLRPPRYPYAIDRLLAERGRELFNSADIGCAGCHGVYDGRGNVDWPGKHVDVGTDRSRIDVVSDGFIEAFNGSPLATDGKLRKSRGYAATPLTGVWATFPYLHNGSVPTLHHLLGPPSERPAIFEVMAARTLDRERVGQPLSRNPRDGQLGEDELIRRFGNDRNWFSTARPGSANAGHDFWSRIRTDANRLALIEYSEDAVDLPMIGICDALIVGAGPAGLATSRELSRAGVRHLVVERGDQIGETWANLYDSLVFHTARRLSALPGLAFPRGTPQFPTRAGFLDYLHRYADELRLRVETGVDVTDLRRADDIWIARTGTGREIEARAVVVATGIVSNPHVPDIPGRARFGGRVIHSVDYRRPDGFRGQRVLVVGAGNSAGDISVELARTGVDVTLAVRTGAALLPRAIAAIPIQYFSVALALLPRVAQQTLTAMFTRASARSRGPAVLPPPPAAGCARVPLIGFHLADAVREGTVRLKGGIAEFTTTGVRFQDDTVQPFDVVILATGYRAAVGLVRQSIRLDACGFARRHDRTTSADQPDLHFVGHNYDIRGGLFNIRCDARLAAAGIKSALDERRRTSTGTRRPHNEK